MNTSPAVSTATACGPEKPEPRVRTAPLGKTSLTRLLWESAMNTSPDASTATPRGSVKPEPKCLDCAVGQDLLDEMIAEVGHEHVAGRVHRHARRQLEP